MERSSDVHISFMHELSNAVCSLAGVNRSFKILSENSENGQNSNLLFI